MQFVLTNAGQLLIDSNPGVAPDLQSFKLGSGFGYTPNPGQSNITGLEVHTGLPSNPVIQASNLIKYTLFLDYSLGNFNFGEVALFAPGNVLFAIGTSTTQIPKVKSEINVDGNSLSIDCYVSTSGTTYSIYAELGNSDININIPSVSGIDVLPPAYTAIPNTYQVSSPGQLSSVLAFSNNSRWSVTGYDTEIHPQLTVAAGSTASSIRFVQTATNPTTPGELLIQGLTGLNAGSIRIIGGYSSGTNAYSVNTSFLYQPQVGDLFSVVRRNYLTSTAIGFLNGLNPGVGAGQTNGLQSIDLNKIFMTDGSRPAINNLDIANYRITNVGNPTASKDAVHKQWLDDTLDNFNTTVVNPIATAPRVQIGVGAPIGTIPTTPPFYVDKSTVGRYDLYINDSSTSAWTRVYPLSEQYGVGAPVLGTTPSSPTTYYDTSVSTRYIPYVFRNGDWHRVGYTDPGINFTGGVTITDSLSVGVSGPNPLSMTGGGFQTSNTLGINFDMKSIGLNSTLRNRWPSTYAFTLNTSTNETGAYELCRNNTAFGGMRIIEDGTVHVGSKGLNSFHLIYNNAAVASVSTGFFDIFPTYNAWGQLRVNSKVSVISGVAIGSHGTNSNIVLGSTSPPITTGTNNISMGASSSSALTTGYNNTVVGAFAFNGATAGTSNVAIGDGCLQSVVTADGRTVVGSGANSISNYTTTIGHLAYSAGANQVSIGLRARGGTGTNNISIGASSMELATTAEWSIAIGDSALRNNAGAFNVAVGHGALVSNTSGTNNLAMGNNSMYFNTSGSFNVGLGLESLKSLTTGSENTAIGYTSGLFVTTSTNNTFVGRASGVYVATGSHNTAIGSYALSAANNLIPGTGVENVAVGSRALFSNSSGNVNIAVGFSALTKNTTGSANCAIGDRTLFSNTSGTRNVGVGGSSLVYNTVGSDNIAIGCLTLNSLLSGSNNIAIGSSALTSNTSSSDTIAIGHHAMLLNTTATASVIIGNTSGYYLTTASGVTTLGYGALKSSTFSTNSVCIGSYVTEQTLSTIGDVYIGADAGRNTAGTFSGIATESVYVGYRASHSRLGLGSNNVGLGAKTFETSSTTDSAVAVGHSASNSGAHSYTVELGAYTGSRTGTYNSSTLIGYSCLGGATSVGTVQQSTIIGARAFLSANVSSVLNSILIGDGLYNSSSTINLNNVIILAGTASSTSATNEITIGNGTHTSYRMYATGWSNVSDVRDKKNIRPFTDGLSLINKLNPVRFQWNSRDGGRAGDEDSGFIAQELQEALGTSNTYLKVVNEANPDQLMVTKDGLYPVIIKSIQELSVENAELRSELQKLRADLDSLLNR